MEWYWYLIFTWVIAGLFFVGPIFTKEEVKSDEYISSFLLCILLSPLLTLMCLEKEFREEVVIKFYGGEKIQMFVYFLPVLSLGLLWLI